MTTIAPQQIVVYLESEAGSGPAVGRAALPSRQP